mmetsp:Transcript_107022/g.289988  ORF Transcript_107022/g.289988 Transcript_107022/m.289988 type:complete len:673 (-) Transcript_107022:198-2216(-)
MRGRPATTAASPERSGPGGQAGRSPPAPRSPAVVLAALVEGPRTHPAAGGRRRPPTVHSDAGESPPGGRSLLIAGGVSRLASVPVRALWMQPQGRGIAVPRGLVALQVVRAVQGVRGLGERRRVLRAGGAARERLEPGAEPVGEPGRHRRRDEHQHPVHGGHDVPAPHGQVARRVRLDPARHRQVEHVGELRCNLDEARGSVLQVHRKPRLRVLVEAHAPALRAERAAPLHVRHEGVPHQLRGEVQRARGQLAGREARDGEALRPAAPAERQVPGGARGDPLVETQRHREKPGAVLALLEEGVLQHCVRHLPPHRVHELEPRPHGRARPEGAVAWLRGVGLGHPHEDDAEVNGHHRSTGPLLRLHQAQEGLRVLPPRVPAEQDARLRPLQRRGELCGVPELVPPWLVRADRDGVEVPEQVLQPHPEDAPVRAQVRGSDFRLDLGSPVLLVVVREVPLPLQPRAPRVAQLDQPHGAALGGRHVDYGVAVRGGQPHAAVLLLGDPLDVAAGAAHDEVRAARGDQPDPEELLVDKRDARLHAHGQLVPRLLGVRAAAFLGLPLRVRLQLQADAGPASEQPEALAGRAALRLLVAAPELGERLLDKGHPELIPAGAGVRQHVALVAREVVVGGDEHPLASITQPQEVHPLGAEVAPPGVLVHEQPLHEVRLLGHGC